MTVSLLDAVRALDERKTAAWGAETSAVLDRRQAGVMLLGTDMDFDEAWGVSRLATITILTELFAARVGIARCVQGGWFDGLLTGLMLAELRAQERAADGEVGELRDRRIPGE